MSARLRLRRGGPRDCAALHGIWERAVRATHGFLEEADVAAYSELVRCVYLPRAELIVAESGGVAVGFVGLEGVRIEALFVDPAWHGRGVGRRLIGAVRARIPAPRVDVNEANAAARRFYARMGFREIGRSPHDAAGKPYPLLHLAYDG